MAIGLWRAPPVTAAGAFGRQPATVIIRQAILINLLNPKLSIFFLAFLPQFVEANSPDALAQMTVLSLTFMVMTFVVFAGYGQCAASLRHHVLARPRITRHINRTFAAAFLLMAGRLALAQR
jgi:threonine/homoserine/homoserine lactone efflux protein